MTAHLKTQAFVLNKAQGLEKDTVVTLFTQAKGKVSAFAKGARNLKSKRMSSLMTGNLIEVILYERNDRYYLQDASIVSLFSGIKKDSLLSNDLYFFFVYFEGNASCWSAGASAYELLKKYVIELSKGSFTRARMVLYLKMLLSLFGYGEGEGDLHDLIVKTEAIIGKKIPVFII
jgi:DNA repair protein RecO (recombination protein O)